MRKILVICGPTAMSKTGLGLRLAEKFNGELVSADSRQAYRKMDIGTGKDLPKGNKVRVWGYDVADVDENWGVAAFYEMALGVIDDIRNRGKLPVIVGGTGLYLRSLFNPPETMGIAPDKKLREELEKLGVKELQDKLKKLNPEWFNKMNYSDRNNPRRLVRAVEISKIKNPRRWRDRQKSKTQLINKILINIDTFWVGLTANLSEIDRRIEVRVKSRLKNGVEKEVRDLVEKYGWNRVLTSTIAYQEWQEYFKKKKPLGLIVDEWTTHEKQYARRQLTWFKKQPEIKWFDVGSEDYERRVEREVRRWYDN